MWLTMAFLGGPGHSLDTKDHLGFLGKFELDCPTQVRKVWGWDDSGWEESPSVSIPLTEIIKLDY
jgi:hypothetical protein